MKDKIKRILRLAECGIYHNYPSCSGENKNLLAMLEEVETYIYSREQELVKIKEERNEALSALAMSIHCAITFGKDHPAIDDLLAHSVNVVNKYRKD